MDDRRSCSDVRVYNLGLGLVTLDKKGPDQREVNQVDVWHR